MRFNTLCAPIKHKKNISILLLFIFILIFSSITTVYAEKVKPLWTPEDVVSLPEIGITDISPNGKYTFMEVVYTSLKDKKVIQESQCVLVNNEDLAKEIIGTLEKGCSKPKFIGDGDKFSYLLEDKDGKSLLFIKDMVTGQTVEVQGFENDFGSYAFAPDGKSFVYTKTEESQDNNSRIIAGEEEMIITRLYLQKIDQDLKPSGKPQLLTPPPLTMYHPFYISYTWSPDSQKIAFTTSMPIWKSEPSLTIHLLNLKEKKMETIEEGAYGVNNLFFSSDGQNLAFLKKIKTSKQGMEVKPLRSINPQSIQVIDLKTKKAIGIIATDIEDIAGWTEDNKGLIVRKLEGTKAPLYLLDINTKKSTRMEVSGISCISGTILSKNQKYIGFLGQNLSLPGEAYVAALNHFVPKKVTSIKKGIDLSKIHAHSLRWKSYDGLEIEGILVYPQGYKTGQKVPLVASIHGGPPASDSEQFIGSLWLSGYSPAVFASQGYATLAVNYRGSKGYGLKFQKLDYQDMGGGDFKDIMTGVDHLIDQGIADPDKLFIQGHSYGGFMSAWAVGQTNRFKAASVGAGIVDWISDVATTDYPMPMTAIFGEYYWNNYDLWRTSSPLSYVIHVTTPTLILQGQVDTRVSKTQAQQFYQALRDRKIPTRFVYYFHEDHGFDNSFAIIDAMNETLDWFKIHGK